MRACGEKVLVCEKQQLRDITAFNSIVTREYRAIKWARNEDELKEH